MNYDKGLIAGSSGMLVLSLLQEKECYGYELIKLLKERSANKAVNGRTRRYYAITAQGLRQLKAQQEQWISFSSAVNQVLSFQGNG